ncbi:MAG: YgjV family protein [Clostridia bacterium]|nr:YgjV family protein [Clostridia bacterium]
MEITPFGKYTLNLYTEIMGIVALIIVVIGYFGKTRKQFYFTQVLANIALSTGFLFKGNLLAGIGIAIATLRSLTFLVFDVKNKDVPIYLVGAFIAFFVINGIINWSGIIDLLSIIALVTNTLFCQIKDQKKMKFCMLLPVSLTIVYDVFCLFITKTILKTIELVSIIIFFVNATLKEKKDTNKVTQVDTAEIINEQV